MRCSRPSITASAPAPSSLCTATAIRHTSGESGNWPSASASPRSACPTRSAPSCGWWAGAIPPWWTPISRPSCAAMCARWPTNWGNARLMFMKSDGGLTDARFFEGKDAILSGPAGGIVSCARTGQMAGFERIIGFDMGGTSTDVSHFAGEFERTFETVIAGVRMRVPDDAHPYRGGRRRLHRAISTAPATASAPIPPAPTPAPPATAAAARSPSPTAT